MKNVFTVALSVAALSVSAVSFANDDTKREEVRSLKAGIASLEKNLTAQGIEFNKASDVATSNLYLEEKALKEHYADLQSAFDAAR
ncbi:hypothetical protein CBF23_004955 [Marinomonas agarivorans]|nr:hypothetical protein CBF23_011250 [Marinomonas agarivorans]TBR41585.1 hypothetical protein CBF23_009760 [Marinomonas agarivorans]TBR43529.1 hypothetical protein CBF23_004955 [Marinomonas agarivorans]